MLDLSLNVRFTAHAAALRCAASASRILVLDESSFVSLCVPSEPHQLDSCVLDGLCGAVKPFNAVPGQHSACREPPQRLVYQVRFPAQQPHHC